MSVDEAASPPPFEALPFKPPKIDVEHRADGSILVRSLHEMAEAPRSMVHLFIERAKAHPDRKLICQRGPAGTWECATYGQVDGQSHALAQALIERGYTQETPVLILSGNSIAHAVMAMGALKARVPYAAVSPAASLAARDLSRLHSLVSVVKPRLLFAEQGALFAQMLETVAKEGMEIVVGAEPPEGVRASKLTDLLATAAGSAVDASIEKVEGETVASYGFTAGVTGLPKAVIQTHAMLAAGIGGLQALRLRTDDCPDVLECLEWATWSEFFPGTIRFYTNILAGGTLYLEAGGFSPGTFAPIVRGVKEIAPREFHATPAVFSLLADASEKDHELRRRFFEKVRLVGCYGAGLSQGIFDRLQALAMKETGHRLPVMTFYGSTETQIATMLHWGAEETGLIGLPIPGVTLKLVPNGSRLEIRVKSSAVTPGYLGRPDLTDRAFDAEGFFCTGDAATFLDKEDPAKGLVFRGRLTEDFTLASGERVAAATVRVETTAALAPLVEECVVVGEGREDVRILAWPALDAAREICMNTDASTPDEVLGDPAVHAFVRERLFRKNQSSPPAHRVKRVMFMLELPSVAGREVSDEGHVDRRAVLERRARLVDLLYGADLPQRTVEL